LFIIKYTGLSLSVQLNINKNIKTNSYNWLKNQTKKRLRIQINAGVRVGIEHRTSCRSVFHVIGGGTRWNIKRWSGTRGTLGDLKIQ